MWWYSLGWPSLCHLSFQESTEKSRGVKEVICHLCGTTTPPLRQLRNALISSCLNITSLLNLHLHVTCSFSFVSCISHCNNSFHSSGCCGIQSVQYCSECFGGLRIRYLQNVDKWSKLYWPISHSLFTMNSILPLSHIPASITWETSHHGIQKCHENLLLSSFNHWL